MHFYDFDNDTLREQLSGERFSVTYEITGSERECREIAEQICVEQSVEFPRDQLPPGEIIDCILGQIEEIEKVSDHMYAAKVSYAVETASAEFTQFLNVIFGNFSIQKNVKVVDVELCQQLLNFIGGPRYGIDGIREIIGVKEQPPLFTALKPMGLSSANFARIAGVLAENGVNIIKDDHGLADQAFAPFKERVRACCDAVHNANAKTGEKTIYVPNITAPATQLWERAFYAKEQGAGGIMVAPGLIGYDSMKCLADDDRIDLPIFAHPAFSGSMAINPQGFSLQMLYGLITRLAGADASIFPSYGGRFSFSIEECVGILLTGKRVIEGIKPMFSCPAGGMQLDRIPDMIENYGRDIILLIGGGLFSYSDDLAANCRRFAETVKALS